MARIQTLEPAPRYSLAQLTLAARIMVLLDRGDLLLVEPPES